MTKTKKAETRRDFIKASVVAATGLAAIPLLAEEKNVKFDSTTKVSQLEHMKESKALMKSKNLTVGDLNELMKIAIGSLKGSSQKFSGVYESSGKMTSFKGLTSTDLAEIAEYGYAALTGTAVGACASCGSCASCCCCCCPCCCCS
jgi:hypothetical protein